jgi:hypothetical protein
MTHGRPVMPPDEGVASDGGAVVPGLSLFTAGHRKMKRESRAVWVASRQVVENRMRTLPTVVSMQSRPVAPPATSLRAAA